MSKLKALIYRESVILKKQYILCMILDVIIMLFAWLIMLSMKIGNLAKVIANDPTEHELSTISAYVCIYLIVVIFSDCISLNTFQLDMKSKWHVFSITLPATPLQQITVIYMIKLFRIIAVLAVSIINAVFMCHIVNKPLDIKMLMNFVLIIDCILFVEMLRTPLLVRAKTEKEILYAKGIGFGAEIFAICVVMLIFKNKSYDIINSLNEKELPEDEIFIEYTKRIISDFMELLAKIEQFAVPIMFILLAAGFGLSLLASKRRDK